MRVTSDKPDELENRSRNRRRAFLVLFTAFVVVALFATGLVGLRAMREQPALALDGLDAPLNCNAVLRFPLHPFPAAELLEAGPAVVEEFSGDAWQTLRRALHNDAAAYFYVSRLPGGPADWVILLQIRRPQKVYHDRLAGLLAQLYETDGSRVRLYYRLGSNRLLVGNNQERVDEVESRLRRLPVDWPRLLPERRAQETSSAFTYAGPWLLAPARLHALAGEALGGKLLENESAADVLLSVDPAAGTLSLAAVFHYPEEFAEAHARMRATWGAGMQFDPLPPANTDTLSVELARETPESPWNLLEVAIK